MQRLGESQLTHTLKQCFMKAVVAPDASHTLRKPDTHEPDRPKLSHFRIRRGPSTELSTRYISGTRLQPMFKPKESTSKSPALRRPSGTLRTGRYNSMAEVHDRLGGTHHKDQLSESKLVTRSIRQKETAVARRLSLARPKSSAEKVYSQKLPTGGKPSYMRGSSQDRPGSAHKRFFSRSVRFAQTLQKHEGPHARVIQTAFRAWQARQWLQHLHASAVKIQACVRMHQTKKLYNSIREAVVFIQRHGRRALHLTQEPSKRQRCTLF